MNNKVEAARIRLKFKDNELTVKLEDHSASRDFLALLPLTLTLEDYANTEKISNLPKRLSITDTPSGTKPSAGDFTYYSPWGNLAIFYKDFGFANGLVKLGQIESGIEKLMVMTGDFKVTIEKME
ncbi:cyclophilin-like fold protein [Bacillus sp. AK031]